MARTNKRVRKPGQSQRAEAAESRPGRETRESVPVRRLSQLWLAVVSWSLFAAWFALLVYIALSQ